MATFSHQHDAIVTTHSPAFFDASETTSFCKLRKEKTDEGAFTVAHPVSLTAVGNRDKFQIIGFENNTAALFADQVVLIEGDSDYIALPHVARTLDASRRSRHDVMFVRVSGKGSFQRYREFFSSFGVRTSAICDLDAVLNGFDKLQPSAKASAVRSELCAELDAALPSGDELTASSGALKDIKKGAATISLWRRSITAQRAWKSDPSDENWGSLIRAMEDLLDRTSAPSRLSILAAPPTPEIANLKRDLLGALAEDDTFVLSRGCIEDYYPDEVTGKDKVAKALDFKTRCTTAGFLDKVATEPHGVPSSTELEGIFEAIFA